MIERLNPTLLHLCDAVPGTRGNGLQSTISVGAKSYQGKAEAE